METFAGRCLCHHREDQFTLYSLRMMQPTTGSYSAFIENLKLSLVFRKFVPKLPKTLDALSRCFVLIVEESRDANKAFDQYLAAHSIRREYTATYTPEHNSVAERENRTIMEGVRSCLHQARINIRLWVEAVQYLVYTLNRTGTIILFDYTPFEAYFGVPQSVAHLRPFGCPTFVHIPAPLRRKLDPKAQHGIFVGYSDESKAYRIWIPDKYRIVTSRDVTFDEDKIVQYNLPESQSATTHPSLIPSMIINVATPSPPTPPAAPPPPLPPPTVILFSPHHNFNSISTVSVPSIVPSPDSGQEILQRLLTPISSLTDDPYDFSALSQPIHPVSPPRPMVPVSIPDTTPRSPAPVPAESSSPNLS